MVDQEKKDSEKKDSEKKDGENLLMCENTPNQTPNPYPSIPASPHSQKMYEEINNNDGDDGSTPQVHFVKTITSIGNYIQI
jgi:hypothetical protein